MPDGYPFLSLDSGLTVKELCEQMVGIINAVPGGIAIYQAAGERFLSDYFSDGVLELSGYSREEYGKLVREDALNIVYEADKSRVLAGIKAAMYSGNLLDIFYRMQHKNGNLIWIHLSGRRMGRSAENAKFCGVFTGMSSEVQLFQTIANDTADGIYVIDRETYDLLYVNESKNLFQMDESFVGQKCYHALHGEASPCSFCTLLTHKPDGQEHEMKLPGSDRCYVSSFREMDWNGIPAYVRYIKDVTEEAHTRREKERLEQYFQTMVKYLPGGVAVLDYRKDAEITPEFLSEGYARMLDMSLDEAWQISREDETAGIHPEDLPMVRAKLEEFVDSGDSRCEIVYRLRKGNGNYLWVKTTISVIQGDDGKYKLYASYHDMTEERMEQKRLRQQFNDMLMQHYRTPGPNALFVGHCNVSQNRILEMDDYTDSHLLEKFGSDREDFFTGISSLVVDDEERQAFLDKYLNAPSLAAYQRGEKELLLRCFIKLPKESTGRYVLVKVNLVKAPDTGDVTGILTVTDVTEQTINDRILHQLTVSSYDFVLDLDLFHDQYMVLTGSNPTMASSRYGSHSVQVLRMLENVVVPKDRDAYARALDPEIMMRRLEEESSYTFSYSMIDEEGDIRTKSMSVSAVDLRLGHVCLVRTDITDSVREQQGLLNVVAYTFELLAFIKVDDRRLTLHTRQTVLENLPPFVVEDYGGKSVGRLTELYGLGEEQKDIEDQFRLETMLKRLQERPSGYDFVLPYRSADGLRYKQVNVLWGDRNRKTVCMVRADVTDMLTAERQAKDALEKALKQAEEANQAKSDFLSSMSHDIRTPMNAIIGMTALAMAHLGDRDRLEDYLKKISFSSKHLLSLINDILDMSKIERGKITLNPEKSDLPGLVRQMEDMMKTQADEAGVFFETRLKAIEHPYFYGDSLRINQIMINILGNAVKFTPEGGRVEFLVKELIASDKEKKVRYLFTVRDTGIGMSEVFLQHIFEPFTRNRNMTDVEGTGLGLSITKGLVELMNGVIRVESKQFQGTAFEVELEFERADGSIREDRKAELPGFAQEVLLTGCCFLIAEDNAINSEILSELLRMYGADSMVKADGAQAVKEFERAEPGTYDAVLMDIQMPVMNGYEATRAIRKLDREDASSIPIVAMTANAFTEDIQQAMEAGMDAHVSKPVDMQVLLSVLKRVMKK
ncbi:MAG: ATP-binding protein [Blautia sp.]